MPKPSPQPLRLAGISVPRPRAAWIPVLAAASSLAISLYTFVTASRPPAVELIPPRQVRIAQGGPAGAYVYLQPVLVAQGRGERAEVVLDLTLRAEPLAGGQGAEFVWDETGEWRFDPATQELSWAYLSDPAPLLLTAETAQAPTLLFIGPAGWAFEQGAYRLTLQAERAVDRGEVEVAFEVALSGEDVRVLNQAEGTRFLTFEVER